MLCEMWGTSLNILPFFLLNVKVLDFKSAGLDNSLFFGGNVTARLEDCLRVVFLYFSFDEQLIDCCLNLPILPFPLKVGA